MKLNIRFYSQLLLVTALFFSSLSIGQENPVKPKSDFWEKVRFGGGVGINFRNNATNIAVAPSALYQPNEYIAFGPGLNYTYQKFNDLSTSLFGGSAIFIAKPIDLLQVSVEFEQLRVNRSFEGRPDIDAFWNSALFLGAGYNINIGGSRLGAAGIRYNVLFDADSANRVYSDAWQPFFRVYF